VNRISTHYVTACLIALVCVGNPGCSGRDEPGPPQLHLGSDVCDFCKMIISDQHFAAACIVRTPDDRFHTAMFDDIGCLLVFDQAKHDSIEHRYVTDYDSGDWLDAAQAFYIQSQDVRSPMASGIIASQTQAGAEGFADRFNSSVLRFNELGGHTGPGDPENRREDTTTTTHPIPNASQEGDDAASEILE
jgi:nitrous oxide reductase accessory protein NosL